MLDTKQCCIARLLKKIYVVNRFVYYWTPSLTKCYLDLLKAMMRQRFLTWMNKQQALKQVSCINAPSCLMQDHDGQCSTRTALATKLGERTTSCMSLVSPFLFWHFYPVCGFPCPFLPFFPFSLHTHVGAS